jgi:transposase-like protein
MTLLNIFRKNPVLVRQRPVCADCGSHGVEVYGMLSWDEKHQDWQISEVRDYYGSCANCGNTEVKIRWENY